MGMSVRSSIKRDLETLMTNIYVIYTQELLALLRNQKETAYMSKDSWGVSPQLQLNILSERSLARV